VRGVNSHVSRGVRGGQEDRAIAPDRRGGIHILGGVRGVRRQIIPERGDSCNCWLSCLLDDRDVVLSLLRATGFVVFVVSILGPIRDRQGMERST
jgi:hypothetical protein